MDTTSKQTFQDAAQLAKGAAAVTGAVLAALIKQAELAGLKRGVGETSLKNILKLTKSGDSARYILMSSQDAATMRSYLTDRKYGIKNFCFMNSAVSGQKMLIFNQSDEKNILSARDDMINNIQHGTFVHKNQFFADMKDKEIYVVDGFSREASELMREISRRSKDFHYTAVKIDGKYALICSSKDRRILDEHMRTIAAIATSEQGAKIIHDMRVQLKGRQEVNITVEEAEKERVILDKNHTDTFVKVTAQDFAFYKANKEISRIPRTEDGALDRVYDCIAEFSEPCVLEPDDMQYLDTDRRKEILDNAPSYRQEEGNFLDKIDREEVQKQLNNGVEVAAYLRGFDNYYLKPEAREKALDLNNDRKPSVDDVIASIEEKRDELIKERQHDQPDRDER